MFQAIAERIPFTRRARLAREYEPVAVSQHADVTRVQSALRAAEGGDTRELFALYRDIVAGDSHIQSEFNKRKLAMLSQPMAVLPFDKQRAEDVTAALAVTQMVSECENWTDGIVHLLDGVMWPLAVAEKIYAPAEPGVQRPVPVQYRLKRIEPVNPALFCFRKDYNRKPTPEQWEPELKFWSTDEDGKLVWMMDRAYYAERERHIVHRGHLLIGAPDNWGGPMRAVLFWWLLGVLGRDWFARAMERFGVPFPVGHTDSKDPQAIKLLEDAFSLSTKIGGLVVDSATQVELKEIALSGLADAHERFLAVCNREKSKLIVGQELSATAAATGMGSGVANLQANVREDIRVFDQMRTGETLRGQVFGPWLRLNGIAGNPPKAVWGGLSDADAKTLGELLELLNRAGWEPADSAIPTLQERIGFEIQRKAPQMAQMESPGGAEARMGEGEKGLSGENEGIKDSREDAKTPMEEEEDSRHAKAEGLSARVRGRIRLLSAQGKMAESMGVPAGWLNPMRDFLEELQAKAADRSLSDEDLVGFLEEAVKRVPELFGKMDVEALAKVIEAGMGEAVMSEVRRGIRKNGDAVESVPTKI